MFSAIGGAAWTAGSQVSVSAEPSNANGHFTGWTVTDDPTGAGVLDDANAASTTFTMPAGDVTLTADYGAHDYVDGFCTVCGFEDPSHVAPEEPGGEEGAEPGGAASGKGDESLIPATGDSALVGAAAIGAAGAAALARGALDRRRNSR